MSEQFNNEQVERRKSDQRSYYGWLVQFASTAFIVTLLLVGGAFALFKLNVLPLESNVAAQDSAESNGDSISIEESKSEGDTSDVVQAVSKASDAVVGVTKYEQSQLFAENNKAGTGSGVIYKKENGEAYVVTNHHVIENAQSIDVTLSDGEKVEAELLGSDSLTDLAVLKIDAEHVKQVAEFGSSSNLQVGETAIAIGNPLGLEFAGSVTKGIISGLERTMPVDLNKDGRADYQTEVLQTDAAINPGNSGGALINSAGQVIGINSMKIAQQEVEGLGFAIPSETAKPIIEDLERNGEVSRPFIGVSTMDLSSVSAYHIENTLKLPGDIKGGVLVADVEQGSPAAQANLQQYDVIVGADGEEISNLVDLRKYMYEEKEVGDSMELSFYRDGAKQSVTITLSK
ncbi:S1C family serine protease [Pontibacillus salipaludis]|uniref:Serine protease YyxA n=1 Tax=Pontibacillus salipaludis TaxID=1697394 RepID=A0ABQ1PR92_9BACI|nr:S1C family serine protease [Pontibacillus salipaludis]GGD01560.1 putative serine protease YyxA [Pontibacillus salipaludis]